MKLTISEAARRAGVKRQVLYRQMEKGLISKENGDDGKPVIDLSELCRIYPQAANYTGQDDSIERQSAGQTVAGGGQAEIGLLREMIASLEADKAMLRRDLEHERGECDRLLGLVERHTDTVRLLTDQRTPPPPEPSLPEPTPKRGLWARLRGQ